MTLILEGSISPISLSRSPCTTSAFETEVLVLLRTFNHIIVMCAAAVVRNMLVFFVHEESDYINKQLELCVITTCYMARKDNFRMKIR